MSDIPTNLKYSKSHEWIEMQADGTAKIGITDHAQSLLGDMVYVEVPEEGRELALGEECAVVESVKAASDVYSPLSGTVIAVNESLADSPDLINSSCYGDGWIMQIKLSDESEMEELLDAEAYEALVAEEEH